MVAWRRPPAAVRYANSIVLRERIAADSICSACIIIIMRESPRAGRLAPIASRLACRHARHWYHVTLFYYHISTTYKTCCCCCCQDIGCCYIGSRFLWARNYCVPCCIYVLKLINRYLFSLVSKIVYWQTNSQSHSTPIDIITKHAAGINACEIVQKVKIRKLHP